MELPLNMAKALADGNRIRVAAALMEHEELCACQITEMLRLASATVSRHMSILQAARLVQSRKDGRWVYFRLAESFPELLHRWLEQSLSNSQEVAADRKELKIILSRKPVDLCRKQRQRKQDTEGRGTAFSSVPAS